ncbi:DEAD/DEAH box helicase family protein [Patescibacteria group bacterium]
MALHKDFPKDKFAIADPGVRWFPADEDLRDKGYEKLLPPLVAEIRNEVHEWRKKNYEGVSETSKALLNWWFNEQHNIFSENGEPISFQYYFAQREAVESIIWLYEVAQARNKYDLIKYDSSGRVSAGMFDEEWLRLVIKMATGSGKTKVMSLLIAWSYFHKLYEKDSELSKNFLFITPNIIVLERIKTDLEGLKIFYEDPILPDNGYQGQNWGDDFQVTLHLQDEVGTISKTGNIFLTNIHRVYEGDSNEPSIEDDNLEEYFLGPKPVAKTTDTKVDLGDIIRDIDELMVINDEAHHIHDPKMAWFKSIQDIHNQLLLKDSKLALQIDVTATPKGEKGNIFVQTICDYPLVEAIYQEVVKQPVVPDEPSRAKLEEVESAIYSERYKSYLDLGVIEWRKQYNELIKNNKKSILFIMTDDTKNCDEVAEYLETTYSELKGAVLTIHTNKSGDIAESATGKKKEELDKLRKQANEIDSMESPYKVIVSVLMLKEGWDVKNVTTIVGLRAYTSKSNILPEQTLGRGLRRMFFGQNVKESVSVLGTEAFMDFVNTITAEGVEFEQRTINKNTGAIAPAVIEVDKDNTNKDIEKLDIEIPIMTPRIQREYKNLSDLDVSNFKNKKMVYETFSKEQQKEIIFADVVENIEHHKTIMDNATYTNYQNVIGFFANTLVRDMHLIGGFDILFGKIKEFILTKLFDQKVDLDDPNMIRNLSSARKVLMEVFKKEVNDLTVKDIGDTEIKNYIKVSEARPFVVNDQKYLKPKKSVFNKIVGDSDFELEFADFLEGADDIISYAKNYIDIHFRIDYRNADGAIANYYPDFLVKVDPKTIYVIETKGREDLDDIEKIKRLEQWCKDATERQKKYAYKMLYVKQDEWEKYKPKSFKELVKNYE